jgi:hypothetical protein
MYQEIANGRYTICYEVGEVQYSFAARFARAILEFLSENGDAIGAPRLPMKNLTRSQRDVLEEMRERENEQYGEVEAELEAELEDDLSVDYQSAVFQADYHRRRIDVLTAILGDREEWEADHDA